MHDEAQKCQSVVAECMHAMLFSCRVDGYHGTVMLSYSCPHSGKDQIQGFTYCVQEFSKLVTKLHRDLHRKKQVSITPKGQFGRLLLNQYDTLVANGSDMLSIFTIGTGPAWNLSAVAVAPLFAAHVLRHSPLLVRRRSRVVSVLGAQYSPYAVLDLLDCFVDPQVAA